MLKARTNGIPVGARPGCFHSERSEESLCGFANGKDRDGEILRFAQNDSRLSDDDTQLSENDARLSDDDTQLSQNDKQLSGNDSRLGVSDCGSAQNDGWLGVGDCSSAARSRQ